MEKKPVHMEMVLSPIPNERIKFRDIGKKRELQFRSLSQTERNIIAFKLEEKDIERTVINIPKFP